MKHISPKNCLFDPPVLEKSAAGRMRHEAANWVTCSGVDFTHAVTLTFADELNDRIVAERRFGVFMHMLNGKLFRRAYTNGNKRLEVFAVLEGLQSTYKRLHYHCAIRFPDHASARRVREEVQHCWNKANKASECRVDVRPCISAGWIEYLTKELKMLDSTSISEHCHF